MDTKPNLVIEADITISGNIAHNLKIEGRHYDSNLTVKESEVSNFSFEYSGRHDHGKLASLNSDEHYSKLIGGLIDLRAACENILSTAVATEGEDNPSKKQKVADATNS